MGAGASGIWEHREETQRPLHETMRLVEAWLMRHAPGGSMPSQTLKHCKMQSRNYASKMAIVEAPCAQIRDSQVYMHKVFTKFHTTILGKYSLSE